jgi:two-component system, cell cycle response regulator
VYDRAALTADPLLQTAIRAVARGSDPDWTLDELLLIAMRATGASAAAALVWDGDRGALAVAGSRGLGVEGAARLEASAATPGHPIHRTAHDRVRTVDEAAADGEPGRVSAWPIVVSRDAVEEPLGALALLSDAATAPAETTDAETADWVAAIADLVGLTVDRARMASDSAERAEWQERVANSDALTGLANARTLARVLELEIARAARQGSALCVAHFDIDDLTAINTDAGRAVGDDVLREVAAVGAESIRLVDTMARWGGDEFMLVAPGAVGTTVVQRIVDSVAARPAIGGRRYTVSAGLARFPTNGTTGDALIEAAGIALRAAQAAGPGTITEAIAD